MNLTKFSEGLTHISKCYQLGITDNHNLELTIKCPVIQQTTDCEGIESIGVEETTLFALVNVVKLPYIEQQDTENNQRILLKGKLLISDENIQFDYSDKITASWDNQGEILEGYFYPIIESQGSVAEAGSVHQSLGKRISGYFELND